MSREEQFLEQLALIERLIAWVCSRRGLRGADAEDFASVVKIRLIENGYAVLSRFEGRSSLETWLFGICRNVARSFRRREIGKLEVSTEELPESVVQPAQEGDVWIRRAHQLLLQALDTLEEEQRAVFVLFEIEQFSMDQVAASLSCPASTCYARLYAARAKVQAQLRRRETLGTARTRSKQ